MIFDAFKQLLAIVEAGGWVCYPLVLTSSLLSYAIAIRWFYLQRGDSRPVLSVLSSPPRQTHGVLPAAINAATQARKLSKLDLNKDVEKEIEFALFDYRQGLSQYKKIIQTIVAITPLLGLLGTVIGMIETFDSLGDMSLFAQQSGGGIAGGISQALITTQIGLIIAIPGLFFERFLSRKEELLRSDLQSIQDSLSK
jgi:biopolymer transport protein ExbB